APGLASALPGFRAAAGPALGRTPAPARGRRRPGEPVRKPSPRPAPPEPAPPEPAPPCRPPRPQPGPGPPRSAPAARGRARAPALLPSVAHARRIPPAHPSRRPHSPRAGPVSAGGAAVHTAL
ncbi:unnamed protein product, partial [Rangifer tarandus platyrhynchus]